MPRQNPANPPGLRYTWQKSTYKAHRRRRCCHCAEFARIIVIFAGTGYRIPRIYTDMIAQRRRNVKRGERSSFSSDRRKLPRCGVLSHLLQGIFARWFRVQGTAFRLSSNLVNVIYAAFIRIPFVITIFCADGRFSRRIW